MSRLLVDLGNSRWKLATADGDRVAYLGQGGYEDIDRLAAAAAGQGGTGPGLLASVVEADRTDRVLASLERAGTRMRRVVSAERLGGVVSAYRDPAQIGVDRLLAMAAVRARHEGPFCVVDVGTAVTIDVVDGEGVHAGGVILPGIDAMRRALLDRTAIPRDAAIDADAVLGRDTPTGVAIGARYAIAGAVERCLRAVPFGRAARLFLGGGDADRLLGLMPSPPERLDHLVLLGLAVVAQAEVR